MGKSGKFDEVDKIFDSECFENVWETVGKKEDEERRTEARKILNKEPTEAHLWETCLIYRGTTFRTYSGLLFSYEIRRGKNGQYTRELWVDRRENSKSLSWSSVKLAFDKIKDKKRIIERPKALGDIRGITYIYGMFYRFGLIDVPKEVEKKMEI